MLTDLERAERRAAEYFGRHWSRTYRRVSGALPPPERSRALLMGGPRAQEVVDFGLEPPPPTLPCGETGEYRCCHGQPGWKYSYIWVGR